MAGFVPEHDDVEALLYRIGMQVAGTFQTAETRLLEATARRLIRDLPEHANLSDILAIVRELEAHAVQATSGITREWAEEVVARAAREGAAAVVNLPRISQVASIADQHILAATLVAYDLGNAFEDMRVRILRYPRDAMGEFLRGGDVYQQVIANHAGQVPLGASTEEARRAAMQEFLERGVTGFTDVAGRRWRIGTYAEMATRSAVGRAYTDATVATSASAGIDLFTVLGGRNACGHCAPWFGQIVAASGSTGPRTVPHAFEDREITVNVAGTLADWRASGAGHPNCLCRPAPYLPGFRVPTMATGYDPAAHAARDRLRELERRERDAKRKQAIAEAAGDDAKARRMRRRVLDIQAETREHVRETGQTRRYERAQPAFAN
ncbi:phage minor capsid protein [Microbacterium sp. gxy059]|uniref:phage minor capsid protein n=1 Tax=Microbacterium sp. gxy059 TaxID=2957199 RepID=UPI003D992B19